VTDGDDGGSRHEPEATAADPRTEHPDSRQTVVAISTEPCSTDKAGLGRSLALPDLPESLSGAAAIDWSGWGSVTTP
jgi:hypothetical protein